jgi:hypothetical protein
VVLLVLSHPLWAATIIVDETTCTLVDAITAANSDSVVGGCVAGSGADTIELTTDVTLTAVNNQPNLWQANGLPVVTSDITIEGGSFAIERGVGAPLFSLLEVATTGTLTLADATLRNGYATHVSGAIANSGFTTLTNCVISSNSATQWGGGISNFGHLVLTNSTVSGNTTVHFGGGGISNYYGYLTVTKSTITGNVAAEYYGGGILNNYGQVTVTNSTVSGNSAFLSGGGIHNGYDGQVTLANSTVSGNSASAHSGGGVHNAAGSRGLTLGNTIIADNPSGGNCGGEPITDAGGNFGDDDTCGSGFAGITPGVDFDTTLADNGGPTQTHALSVASVAIDACAACGLATDQRGVPREPAACDSGSYEFECGVIVGKDLLGYALLYFKPESTPFDVVSGYVSDLFSDKDFSRAVCLGTFSASPATDTLPEPTVGDGRYYLARGLSRCVDVGYGDSSLMPDPRDDLDLGPCP